MEEKIQNVVEEYADKHFLDDATALACKPWPEAKKLYKKMLADFAGEVLSGPLSQKMPENCDTDSHISTGINTSQESGNLSEDDFAKSLAREYAEEISPVRQLKDYPEAKMIVDIMRNTLSKMTAEQIKDFEGFFRFLLRRYCLVEKEAINNAYQQAIEQGKHAHVRCQVESRAKLRLLESLFPEIGKEVEG